MSRVPMTLLHLSEFDKIRENMMKESSEFFKDALRCEAWTWFLLTARPPMPLMRKVFQKPSTPRDEATIQVNVEENRVLVVEGKHEDKEDGKFFPRSFQGSIPSRGLYSEEVASNLSSDGILMITAPQKQKASKINKRAREDYFPL
ncbi:Lethal2essential for life [Caligus rogercresseyi]|uniref:Lethal2essential for life n=1 Tax=Caligus rogercresseyi TaxID=217165 RepID=A0A7T8H2X6_CALRO|nr:Lethal2essential for life [Caligus rogercresseyi]